MADDHRENRRLWNEWSDTFQGLWNADTADGELPPTPTPFSADASARDPLPDAASPEGLDVVELGCGGGQGTVGTALAGAERVVSVDLSEEQLRHARRLRDFAGVDAAFLQTDVTRLPLPDDAFDAAFSEWAFQMVADLDAALAEARRVLRPGGSFLLSVPHPFGELMDDETGELARDYHADPRRRVTIDEAYDAEMVVFDRTVSELHQALTDAGFAVDRIVEPDPRESPAGGETDADGPVAPRDLRIWATVE
ncbi:hypothetical protein JCM17823_28860 [Halorubrum gandharaense]